MIKPTVLIVEDDDALVAFESQALQESGCDIVTTDASTEAMKIIKERRIDLVVLDVDEIRPKSGAPRKRGEGLRFLKELREKEGIPKERLPVVGTTIKLPPGTGSWEGTFTLLGGNAFFEEPFDVDDLVSTVWRLLRSTMKGSAQ